MQNVNRAGTPVAPLGAEERGLRKSGVSARLTPERIAYMRDVVQAFLELQERSQENLIGFLTTDLGLGETMLKMAQTTQISEHRLRLLDNVQAILRAVEH